MSNSNTLETPTSSSAPVAPAAKQSSISVAVRVRPFTAAESEKLVKTDSDEIFLGDGCLTGNANSSTAQTSSSATGGSSSNRSATTSSVKRSIINTGGLRKIINVVDERMLIFDPPETNPLTKMQRNAFPNSFKGSRIREHRFVFDRLFDEECTQDQVYNNTTRPLLDSVLDGYNATVFAYGATGCGKTHTISGTPEDPGVIFLTMKELYEKIEALSDTKIFDVSLSYLEIYNETIRDLLNPLTQCKNLVIREDANNKISVSNLSRHRPNSVEEVMELILQGNRNRTSSPTEANATSSRSHAVLQINVIQKGRTGDITEEHTFATLSIIDLAGSERAAATKNRGARLNEGANINKSLLALGNCINALCDPRRRNHVPYRDSKLTRLLKFSLGGNCKTVMIVCVSPSSQHYDETLNTLKYADRAKEIKTKLIRNQHNLDRHVGSYLKMITEQKQEIEELRARESKVVENALNKRKDLEQRVFQTLLESLESTKKSLAKQSQEKWKKYFLLAKRKLLLLQKIDSEVILDNRPEDVSSNELVFRIYDLCEQLLIKVSNQLPQLEHQYRQPTDLDYILEDSASQTLKRLQNEEGWNEYHTKIYLTSIESMKSEVQTDLLLYSSILYDNLIHNLTEFFYVPRTIGQLLNGHPDDKLLLDIQHGLENLLNGEFDAAMEQFAMEYIKTKLSQDAPAVDDISMMQVDGDDDGPTPMKKQKTDVSPPRILKRPKSIKSVNGKVKKSSTNDLMYDTSMEENNSIIHSDMRFDIDDSQNSPPKVNNILKDIDLDIDLPFDPQLDSPPSTLNVNSNTTRVTNKRLLTDLKRARSPPVSSSNRRLSLPISESKLPLLNKQAASRVSNDT